ncbi:MAG: DUF4249 domain-containing protein [Bacteroidetes bacterium]|nr:MAG: DUF4249 domain-containing protein [Bacteroidota bacterium]
MFYINNIQVLLQRFTPLHKLPLLLGATFLFMACEQVVQLDLPTAAPRLVVDGLYTNQPGQQRVRLSYTAPYFTQEAEPPVRGALVVVSELGGKQDTLAETERGIYRSEKTAILAGVYVLHIFLPDGKHYRSQPEMLYEVPPIDSLYFRENVALNEQDKGYNIFIDTKDPAGVENYYRWKRYVNGQYQNEPLDIIIGFDEYADGKDWLGIQINLNAVQKGDSILVEQLSISKAFYDYLFTLQQQTAFVGGIFDPPPASVKGNMVNVDDVNEQVLGFFRVAAVAQKRAVVE